MRRLPIAIALLSVTLLVSGCGQPQSMLQQRLDPASPAAPGLPALPNSDEPAALLERPTFGLYAEGPSAATLTTLTTGRLSPDGRYRASLTDQGAWVARIDGAWLWQIELPPPPPPPQQSPQPGGRSTAPAPLPPARVAAPLKWTDRSTLLLQDEQGYWYEASPFRSTVARLPELFQGKLELELSPDGQQVLYYTTVGGGRQLWLAPAAGGAEPKVLGENVIGFWDETGQLIIRQQSPATPDSQEALPQQGIHRE